jgi:uncharacterized protein (DUF1015 family)
MLKTTEILPFRGICFNPRIIDNLADVITPPFDVISAAEQHAFYDRHPNNIVRLIRGKATEFDTRQQNPHSRAARHFQQWLSEGILVQDPTPTIYLTALDFDLDGRRVTRYGAILMVRLHPFEEGLVLPHEKTFTNVKSERLSLMKACHANFSPIFSLTADDDGRFLEQIASMAAGQPTDLQFDDHIECRHRLWRISEPDRIDRIVAGIAGRPLYIADGHHRYETALNYRNWVRETQPGWGGNHPANYVMMYLCSMRDPGLVIRPAHRLLTEVPRDRLEALISRAGDYFDIHTIAFNENERDAAMDTLTRSLNGCGGRTCIGAFRKNDRSFYCLTLKDKGIMDRRFGDELAPSLRNIDVTVLTHLIFMELLGFDRSRLDNEKLIEYTVDVKAAVHSVVRGDSDIAFILNPTGVGQVKEVADSGEVMPRKATYFYPKVVTGLVMRRLDGDK